MAKEKKVHLKKAIKKKIVIFVSVFLALIAGLSSSALYLNSRHEQKVAAAIPENRYSGNKIVQTDKELTSDDIGKDGSGIELTSLSDSEIANVKAGADTSDETYVIEQNENGDVTSSESNESEKSPAAVKTDGKHIYLVNYTDASKKQKSAYNKYVENSKNAVSNDEIIFQTADNEGSENNTDASTGTPVDLGGKSLREYADEQGKKLVAVIDTGINDGYAVQSVNFSNSKSDADINGHGTKIAKEIQSASGNKAIIVSLKAMDDNGTGDMFNVMKAVQYAIDQKVDIINMSIVAADDGNSSIFKSVVKSAVDQKIKVVAAAGNYGLKTEHFLPANIDGVIAVGAVKDNGEVTDFSNYGLDNQIYVKNATSTSLAAAEVTGTIVASGSTDKNDNITKDYHLSLNKKLDEIFSGNDNNKFMTAGLDINQTNQYMYLRVGSGAGWFKEIQSSTRATEAWASNTDMDNSHSLLHANGGKNEVLNIHQSDFYFYPNDGYKLSRLNLSGTAGNPVYYYPWGTTTKTPANADGDGDYWAVYDWGSNVWKVSTGNYNSFQPNASKNSTATAYFEPYVVNVHFDGGGGTLQWNTDQTFSGAVSGQSFKDTGAYRTGYDFVNWAGTLGPYGYTSGVSYNWLRDINGTTGNNAYVTLTAQWKPHTYTVTFHDQSLPYLNGTTYNKNLGGTGAISKDSAAQTMSCTYDVGYNMPNGPQFYSNSGYQFVGWSTDPNAENAMYAGGQWFSNLTAADGGNIDLYAIYRKDIDVSHNVSVTTYVNGSTANARAGSSATYDADVMYNAETGERIFDMNTYTYPNSNSSDTSGYRRQHHGFSNNFSNWERRTRNGSGGIFYGYGDDWIRFDRSTLAAGYTYGSIDSSGNATNQTFDPTEDSGDNDGFSAQGGYTDFSNGGTPHIWGRISHVSGSNQNLNVYVRGYRYNVQFNKNSYAGSYHTDGFQTPDDPQVVLANGPDNYSQTFYYGHNGSLKNSEFTWAGHVQTGWNTKPDGSGKHYDLNATSWYFGREGGRGAESAYNAAPTGDGSVTVQLYAEWERQNVDVRVNPNNGTWNGSQNNNQKIQGVTKWGDSANINTPTPPAKTVTVQYELNDGTMPETHPSLEDKAQFEFDHWVISDGNNNEVNNLAHGFIKSGTESITGDGTNKYYASSDTTRINAKYYFTRILLPTPTKEGYTFLGWYYDNDYMKAAGKGNTEYRAPNDSKSKFTLYARWVPDSFAAGDTVDSRMENTPGTDKSDDYKIGKFAQNGKPLSGAIITITDNETGSTVLTLDTNKGLMDSSGKVINSEKDKYGYYKINNDAGYLQVGKTYTATEVQAPRGYFYADDYTFTVEKGKNVTIKMVDPSISSSLKLIKSSIEGIKIPLDGAKFELYDKTDDPNFTNSLAKLSSNTNGELKVVSNKDLGSYLAAGHTMSFVETQAPKNYDKRTFDLDVPKKKDDLVGFKQPPFTQLDYDPETGTVALKDNHIFVNLKIEKFETSKDENGQKIENPLDGATFQLYVMKDGNLYPAHYKKDTVSNVNVLLDPYDPEYQKYSSDENCYIGTTDKNGVVTFNDLAPWALSTGSEEADNAKEVPIDALEKVKDENGNLVAQTGRECDWYLVETGTKKGHNLLTYPIKINMEELDKQQKGESSEIQSGDTITVKVVNNHVVEMLRTGGNGVYLYVAAGAGIIALGVYLMHRKKKEEEQNAGSEA